MKILALLLLLLPLYSFPAKIPAVKPVIPTRPDKLSPAQAATLEGFVAQRLDASYEHRILAQDVNRLVEPFRNRTEDRCWQSEFWGKWFTSAVLAYRYKPEPRLKSILDQAVKGLIATQSTDGYIGNYADEKHLEQWDIWGRKYCMLGLISYYDLTGDKISLAAARKVADHLIKELSDRNALIVKKGNHRGMAASSVLEPVCLLYARTGDPRYLDFANEIVRQWETADGPQLVSRASTDVSARFPRPASWFGWEQGQKAYEMMSCYEGLLELYRLTGKPEYLDAVEKTWQNILDKEINIAGSGSAVECWFGGKALQTMQIDHYQETCVTATWIKLNQQLLRLTGDGRYADAIEQAWYNALLGAMSSDGSEWAKYSPLAGERLHGGEQCGMGLNCCIASGPRGLFTLPLTAVMVFPNALTVNFYTGGTWEAALPDGRRITITQQTDYPVSGDVRIRISNAGDKAVNLKLRIPAWSIQTEMTVNGQKAATAMPGSYADIALTPSSENQVSLRLDMRGRLVHLGSKPEQVAIVRGPVVLARDARLGQPPVDLTVKPLADKNGFIDLQSTGTEQGGIWMKFRGQFMVESHQETPPKPVWIELCDYASAGNTFSPESWFRVWLPQSFDPRKNIQ